MWIKFFCLCLIIGIVNGEIKSQEEGLIFHKIGIQQGLTELTNPYVYKDSKGFVWISSINGLHRFDGIDIQAYFPDPNSSCSISDEILQSDFYEDDRTDIWFCTYGAINVYRRKEDCFDHFLLSDPSFGGQNPNYYFIDMDGDGNIWVIVNESFLFTISTKEGKFNKVAQLEHEYKRGLLIKDAAGSPDRLLMHNLNLEFGFGSVDISDGKFLREDFVLPLEFDSTDFNVLDIVFESDSTSWVMTDNFLYRINFLSRESVRYSLPYKIPTCMENYDADRILIGFTDSGLVEFSKSKGKFETNYLHNWKDPFSLLNNKVTYLKVDRNRTIWCSSTGNGISYAQPEKSKFTKHIFQLTVNNEKVDLEPVTFIEGSSGEIICATLNHGLFTITKSDTGITIAPINKVNEHLKNTKLFSAFKDDDENLWIGTLQRVFVFDKEYRLITIPDAPETLIFSIVQTIDSNILLLTPFVPLIKTYSTLDTPVIKYDLSDYLHTYSLHADLEGRYWIGVDFKRVIIFEEDRRIDSLPILGFIHNVEQDLKNNRTWVTSAYGLYEIESSTNTLLTLHNIKSGFPSNEYKNAFVGSDGEVWATHSSGLMKYNPVTQQIRNYSSEDGLPPLQFNDARWIFEDGEVWLGASGFICSFYPDSIRELEIEAIPQITSLLINDSEPDIPIICAETGVSNITEIKRLVFDASHSTLSFRLNALEYSSPELNKVRYQLIGLDKKELESNSGTMVRYPNIPAGSYTLRVFGSNSDGVFNTVPRELYLTIKPPFYKTWWFISSVVLLIGSILGYIIFLRISKTLEVQKVRLKLYENLHDDIGSRLTAILLSADEMEQQQTSNLSGIQNISSIAKNVIGNMRRLVWAVDPKNDKMEDIVRAISHDKSVILGGNVELNVYVDPVLTNKEIPGEIRYQICSICNESFTNIAKYAKASNVNLNFWVQDKNLQMELKDDGIGFMSDKFSDKIYSGYGLGNMERRVSRMKGKLKIESAPGQGTAIHVSIPMK